MALVLGICSIKLDLEIFSINGPSDIDEEFGGNCTTDQFLIRGQIQAENTVPVICGENSGMHS